MFKSVFSSLGYMSSSRIVRSEGNVFRGPRTISMGATLCLLQPASPGTGSLKDVNILCAFTLLQIL